MKQLWDFSYSGDRDGPVMIILKGTATLSRATDSGFRQATLQLCTQRPPAQKSGSGQPVNNERKRRRWSRSILLDLFDAVMPLLVAMVQAEVMIAKYGMDEVAPLPRSTFPYT